MSLPPVGVVNTGILEANVVGRMGRDRFRLTTRPNDLHLDLNTQFRHQPLKNTNVANYTALHSPAPLWEELGQLRT